jgi:hypothetical protein
MTAQRGVLASLLAGNLSASTESQMTADGQAAPKGMRSCEIARPFSVRRLRFEARPAPVPQSRHALADVWSGKAHKFQRERGIEGRPRRS